MLFIATARVSVSFPTDRARHGSRRESLTIAEQAQQPRGYSTRRIELEFKLTTKRNLLFRSFV
jgi:hypothetical protein